MITREMVQGACEDATWLWSRGDDVLYEMCREDPLHQDLQAVVAKKWLIGRSYAAAIERKRPKDGSTLEDFYSRIAQRMISSDLDGQIGGLRRHARLETESVTELLDAHAALIMLLKPDTGNAKRSFASKYLHFHCPAVVPIFDSIADTTIRRALGGGRAKSTDLGRGHDSEYRIFVTRVLLLRAELEDRHGIPLTLHQLDRLLWTFDEAEAARG